MPVHLHGAYFVSFLLLTGRCYDAETSVILLLLDRAFIRHVIHVVLEMHDCILCYGGLCTMYMYVLQVFASLFQAVSDVVHAYLPSYRRSGEEEEGRGSTTDPVLLGAINK